MHLPRPQGLWLVLGVVASLRACLGNESNHKVSLPAQCRSRRALSTVKAEVSGVRERQPVRPPVTLITHRLNVALAQHPLPFVLRHNSHAPQLSCS